MAKRVMADIVSSPLVLMPFMVGSMAFVSLFALGLKGSAAVGAVLIGLVGTLASAGTFLTKFILGRDDRIRKFVEASRSKAKRDKRKALDHFHHRLTVDGDERTETAMQDLRSLRQAFRQLDKIAPDLNRVMIEDIQQRSEELFQQCVSSLEKTLQLWKTADSLASDNGPQTDPRAARKTGGRRGPDRRAHEPDPGLRAGHHQPGRRRRPFAAPAGRIGPKPGGGEKG